MKKLRIYIENSVVGGYFDVVFEEATKKLFEKFKSGEYQAVISTHTYGELDNGAPEKVKDKLGIHFTQVSLFRDDILVSNRLQQYGILQQAIKQHTPAF